MSKESATEAALEGVLAAEAMTERDARIRDAFDTGSTAAEVAAMEEVSVATVRRSLKRTSSAAGSAEKVRKDPKPEPVPATPETPAKAAGSPKQRTQIESDAVLAFNPKWTDEDRAAVREAFKATKASTFWLAPSGGYIRVEGADGKPVLAVEKSRLRFVEAFAPEGSEKKPDGLFDVRLSTARKVAA